MMHFIAFLLSTTICGWPRWRILVLSLNQQKNTTKLWFFSESEPHLLNSQHDYMIDSEDIIECLEDIIQWFWRHYFMHDPDFPFFHCFTNCKLNNQFWKFFVIKTKTFVILINALNQIHTYILLKIRKKLHVGKFLLLFLNSASSN